MGGRRRGWGWERWGFVEALGRWRGVSALGLVVLVLMVWWLCFEWSTLAGCEGCCCLLHDVEVLVHCLLCFVQA